MVQADLSALKLDYGEMGLGGSCGGNCSQFTKARLVFANESQVLARWPNVGPAPDHKYVWEMITEGGANGFAVKDAVGTQTIRPVL